MGDPDIIMIDEPTEGLAPKIVEQVALLLQEIASPRRCHSVSRTKTIYRFKKFPTDYMLWGMARSSTKERPIRYFRLTTYVLSGLKFNSQLA